LKNKKKLNSKKRSLMGLEQLHMKNYANVTSQKIMLL